MKPARILPLLLVALVLGGAPARAQYTLDDTLKAVVPGLVYREFSRTIGAGNDWRVTDPDAGFVGDPSNSPSTFLPNAILGLTVDDLQGAVRAVAVIDVWGGHVGTVGKQFRLNGNQWVDVPSVANTPGSPECYTQQYTAVVEVPLGDLVSGSNTLEGTSGGQTCFGFDWGQWGWYGFVLRVYYDPAQKPNPTGAITAPASGETIGEMPVFRADASGPSGISRVDFVGRYDDYDVDGNGVYLDWQQSYHRLRNDNAMTLRNHVGTATAAPYDVLWDNTWIPDQAPGGMSLVARIRGADGLWTVTERVTGLTLDRPGVNVRIHRATGVPQSYWVRAGLQRSSNFVIPSIPDLARAESAQLLVATWNGVNGQAEPGQDHWTRVNGWTAPEFGENHFYSFDRVDVPPGVLQGGTNTVTFYSQSSHHGNEILWPGPAVAVRFVDNSTLPAYVRTQPVSTFAFVGETATFTVEAAGATPLSYQWQRNGVDIPGAVGSSYTTDPVEAAGDGDLYRCVVSNGLGSETSAEATLTVLVPGTRHTDGQIVLYGFDEGGGETIFDVGGVGTPADLTIADTTAVSWLAGGLEIMAPTLLATAGAVPKFTNAAMASGEFTVEAWLQPANLTQNGPARIVTLSEDIFARDFTLGQGVYGADSDVYEVRLRTTSTNLNGTPGLATPAGDLTTQLTHVVFTRAAGGATRVFVNGVQRAAGTASGDFSNWNGTYRLGLANELSADRPWLGRLHLVALFDRALSATDVLQNFTAGPVATTALHAEVAWQQAPGGPVTLFSVPDGTGDFLTGAQLWSGTPGEPPVVVDASLLVRLTDAAGDPVVGFPAAGIGLVAQAGGWTECPDDRLTADGPTDVDGWTTISGALRAGGRSAPDELLQVTVDDPGLASVTYPEGLAGLGIRVVSADVDGDLRVNLGDVADFAAVFGGAYDVGADFYWDGAINLSDVTRLGAGYGAACGSTPTSAPPVAGALDVSFDPNADRPSGDLEPGRRTTAYVRLTGGVAAHGIRACGVRLRTSGNVVVHEVRMRDAGLDLATSTDLVAGYPEPRRSPTGQALVLAEVTLSVRDRAPGRIWLETATGDRLPTVVVDDRLRGVMPVSGNPSLPVAALNDPTFDPGTGEVPPVRLALQVVPNPFNPRTEIRFVLPDGGRVDLRVFDTRGQLVAVLRGEMMAAGSHRAVWDGTDRDGRAAASGVYFARLQSPSGVVLQKMSLIR